MLLQDFKAFIFRGNVVDLAIGVVMGVAFGAIVKSLVDDIIMPPLGMLVGGLDFSQLYITLKPPPGGGTFTSVDAMVKAGGVAIRYGQFLNAIVSFLIVAAAVFAMIQLLNKAMRKAPPPAPPAMKDCPLCLMAIPEKALRCGHCTATL